MWFLLNFLAPLATFLVVIFIRYRCNVGWLPPSTEILSASICVSIATFVNYYAVNTGGSKPGPAIIMGLFAVGLLMLFAIDIYITICREMVVDSMLQEILSGNISPGSIEKVKNEIQNQNSP